MNVFSSEKYLTDPLVDIRFKRASYPTWVKECDGLSEEEMSNKGYMTLDRWMIEREEN